LVSIHRLCRDWAAVAGKSCGVSRRPSGRSYRPDSGIQHAINGENNVAGFVAIWIFGNDKLPRLSGADFAVCLRCRLSSQRGASGSEVDAVEMLDELDDIATDIAAATVEYLFFGVDSEPVIAPTFRARTDELCETLAYKLDPAPINFVFN
jgi:hypothetical protein